MAIVERETQIMYLRMEKRTFQAVGDIMGISKVRARQIVYKYQRKCKHEAQKQVPSEYEVVVLLPHIDSIKAIYENDS
jgi:DNA-directed RNA polymerase sigma subunit (sigma70/sigma32)